MKRIQSACLEQTVLFETADDYDTYKGRMNRRRIPYAVTAEEKRPDGSILIKLKRPYTHYATGDYLS